MTARRILVLGAGAQGRVIAVDLARSLDVAITVADLRPAALPELPNLSGIEADLSDASALARRMAEFDLVVGALPSRLGFGAMRAAIDARRPMVDVSFSAEDPLSLDADARRAGVTIAPDCGLAPGLSHLLAGRMAVTDGPPLELEMMVGGMAQDPAAPYGYVVTWSLEDLLEEYLRPARIRRAGEECTEPPLSDLRPVEVPGVGTLESFLSDGLRTALATMPGIPDMAERTLRWPGHVEAIRPLVAQGRLVEELRARCTREPAKDLVVLVVRARWRDHAVEATLVDRWDEQTGLTAMARTTALTTSVVAQLAAAGGLAGAGVRPLELVAADPGAFPFITDALAARGVGPVRVTRSGTR